MEETKRIDDLSTFKAMIKEMVAKSEQSWNESLGYSFHSQRIREYTKEEVDRVITYLSDDEKNLITKRYGADLNNPQINKNFSNEERVEFYGTLKPKILKMLDKQKDGKLEEYLENRVITLALRQIS